MIARDFVDLVDAISIGKKSWELDCPSCEDGQLLITGDRWSPVTVRCSNRCGIYEIVDELKLSWEEFTARPVRVDLLNMDEDEAAAFKATDAERQLKHQDACKELRTVEASATALARKIRSLEPGGTCRELKAKLLEAKAEVIDAKRKEFALRASTPPNETEDDDSPFSHNVDVERNLGGGESIPDYTKRVMRARANGSDWDSAE